MGTACFGGLAFIDVHPKIILKTKNKNLGCLFLSLSLSLLAATHQVGPEHQGAHFSCAPIICEPRGPTSE